ncbi:MAG: 2-amino-4-hydroxy-6-hydroxymethyldihydropteridine diphosphokinase [Thermodesulfobacteriota bacterium]
MNLAYISIGSNIDKQANITACLKKLRNLCAVKEVSSVYETRPVGNKDQESFFNAALILETPLKPVKLKFTVLDAVEKELGRRRTEDKDAPRTIDLDISLFNQWTLTLGKRKIPDPEILQYPHIAIPLAEIAPDYVHPITGETLTQIAARFEKTKGVKRRDDISLE